MRVDTGEIAFLAAYDLSFVEDAEKQQRIADLMASDGYKLDMKKAELLRNYYETGKLTDVTTTQILSGEKTRKPNDEEDLEKALSGLSGLMAGGLLGALGDVISSAIKQSDSETTQNLMKAQSELAAALREQKEILKQWQDAAGDWATALSGMMDLTIELLKC